MKSVVYFSLIAACAVCGCSKNDYYGKAFGSLPDGAVIVKVNDHVLTKKDMLRFMDMEYRNAKNEKGMDNSQLERKLNDDFRKFVPTYISQTLLVDDAKRHAVLTEDEVNKRVDAMIDASAKAKGLSREDFLKRYKQDEWFVRESAAKQVWINAHVAANIPPLVVVTPQMVTNYLNVVDEEVVAAKSTNAATRARLDAMRADCLAGKSVFTNLAAKIDCDNWDFGELERSEFETAALRDVVFSLKEGMISPVLESEIDYFIVYLAQILPAEKNADGKVVQPERRHAYQIALPKADFPIKLTFEQAYKDLMYQVQLQTLSKYVELLKTNGVNKIEWPNGTNIFNRVSAGR